MRSTRAPPHGRVRRAEVTRLTATATPASASASSRLGDAPALLALAGAFTAFAFAALDARVPPYTPGTPLYTWMPPAYLVGLGLAVTAVFLARGAGTRMLAAASTAVLVVMPLVLLLPYGHLHDSNRNLVISTETLAGEPTGMYRDAFPGFWALAGLIHHVGGGRPWDYLRWYPLGVTLVYAILGALVVRGVLRAADVAPGVRDVATGVAVFALLGLGPLVWIRNNLAPESYGFAIGMLLVYLAARIREGPVFVPLFVAAATALVVSHPLSPVFVFPGVLAALTFTAGSLRGAVRDALTAAPRGAFAAVGVLYAAWILYPAAWIIPHGYGILKGAASPDKEVSGLTRILPGSEMAVLVTLVFLVLLAAAGIPLIVRAYRSPVGRFVLLWVLFMSPALAATVGGRFLSRPLLFLLVPAAILTGYAFATLRRPSHARTALAALFVVVVVVGGARAGYVEALDRPTGDEIAAHAFAYASSGPVYRSSLAVHYLEDGDRYPSGSLFRSGGRAFDADHADVYGVRLVTAHALAYGSLQGRNDWPVDPVDVAQDTNASIVYQNADNVVMRGTFNATAFRALTDDH